MFKESIAAHALVIVGVLVVLTSCAVLMGVPGMAEADTARESEAASDLKRSKVISGVVRDEAGKLVSRALVLPLPHGGYPAETDASGAFELEGPSRNRLILTLFVRSPERNLAVAVDLEGQSIPLDIALAPGASLTGRVVDDSGAPVAGADVQPQVRIETYWAGFGFTEFRPTDSAGRYELRALPVGYQYVIHASAEGYGRNVVEDFSVAEAEAYTLRDLVLQPADMSIEGLVFDQYGEPAVNADVLVSGRATVATFTRTDEKGRYRLDNVVNEEVLIQVSSPTHEYPVKLREATAGDTRADVMIVREVGAEEREELQLAGKDAPELEVAAWVHGEPPSAQSVTGKIVLLAFWDSGHESSSEITARLKSLAEEHGDVLVIAVHAANGDPEALQELVGKEGVEFAVALDAASYTKYPGATFEKYKVIRVPAVFIIDAEGKVRYQDIALEAVEEAVQRLLDEQ